MFSFLNLDCTMSLQSNKKCKHTVDLIRTLQNFCTYKDNLNRDDLDAFLVDTTKTYLDDHKLFFAYSSKALWRLQDFTWGHLDHINLKLNWAFHLNQLNIFLVHQNKRHAVENDSCSLCRSSDVCRGLPCPLSSQSRSEHGAQILLMAKPKNGSTGKGGDGPLQRDPWSTLRKRVIFYSMLLAGKMLFYRLWLLSIENKV